MEENNYDILYVDDEQNNLDAFKASFRREFKIVLAISAEEGLKILSDYPKIPIIISDQRMPGTTGSEFFEEVSQHFPDSIRILITGYADLESTIEAINKGKIFYYISKPINPDEVKIILNKSFESYHLQMSNKILTKEREELLIKSEKEEKELIKSQLQNLRSHINPHFLFNSLNILSALVNDNDQAKTYILKLAHVYRYLLKSSDHTLSTLKSELEFIKEYIFLQKIRFTNGIDMKLKIPEPYLEYLIPSYSMQILIENIFKHNAVSEEYTMQINVYIEDNDYLAVSNTLHPKNNLFESSGIGQINLIERYKLVSDKKPIFKTENGLYIALIPLLPPNNNEND
ncbi:MAG: histidine kinase [Cyclobacteriaceae bacterium]|jgi:CheY-like chemotaxis protein